eukprot:scaffold19592_cov53-Phaeocystis_antarctica.AAC.5
MRVVGGAGNLAAAASASVFVSVVSSLRHWGSVPLGCEGLRPARHCAREVVRARTETQGSGAPTGPTGSGGQVLVRRRVLAELHGGRAPPRSPSASWTSRRDWVPEPQPLGAQSQAGSAT